MEKLKQLLGSRKFWASLLGLGLMVWQLFDPDVPLDEAGLEPLIGVIVIIVGYVFSTALEDGLSRQ